MSENNRFFINLSNLLLSNDNTDVVFENVFNVFFDNLLENERFQEAVTNSINTYNDEIFNKNDEYYIDLKTNINDCEKQCLICLELISVSENVYTLECSHIFHKECLDTSIEHQHYECPLCKHKIKVKSKIHWKDEYENNGHTIKLISKNE